MLIRLVPAAVVGKRSPTEDFQLLQQRGEIPEGVCDSAKRWLQVMLCASGNPQAAVLEQFSDDWWLFHLGREASFDAAGRRQGVAQFGRIAERLAPADAVSLLYERARTPVVKDCVTTEIAFSPLQQTSGERLPVAAGAVHATAVGEATVGVRNIAEALDVLANVGLRAPRWIAYFAQESPTSHLPAHAGLLIGGNAGHVPAWAEAGARAFQETHQLRLAELAALPDSPAVKKKLLLSAIDGQDATEGTSDISTAGLIWLARTPSGRRQALRKLRPEQYVQWLTSDVASLDDLPGLEQAFNNDHRAALQQFLRGRPQAVEIYRRYFPDDDVGAVDLLSESERPIWSALIEGRLTSSAAADVERLLERLNGSTALKWIDLEAAAEAVRSCGDLVRPLFAQRLIATGLPQNVVENLVFGRALDRPPPATPILKPQSNWLYGIGADRWLAAKHWASTSSVWNAWWYEGIGSLLQSGGLDQSRLLKYALERCDAGLLELAGAPQPILAWAKPKSFVRLPVSREIWCKDADVLVESAVENDTLLEHLAQPLTDDVLDWIEQRLTKADAHRKLSEFRRRLRFGGMRADELAATMNVLTRPQVLAQLVSLRSQLGPDVEIDLLRRLVAHPHFRPDESRWLAALTLACEPLPAAPRWSAAELCVLLPLLDPVRDVVREIFSRHG
ncbi:MAG: hypothetical protein QM775_24455 [Pirellulales bacterium]